MQGVCEAHAGDDFIDLKIAVKMWAEYDYRIETLLGKIHHHAASRWCIIRMPPSRTPVRYLNILFSRAAARLSKVPRCRSAGLVRVYHNRG